MYAIIVHGGAGDWADERHDDALQGVRNAVLSGIAQLAKGRSALDAVCAAVVVLEDDPTFNAGTGATLNSEGRAELDATVMVGDSLKAGGVANLQLVRNPVLVARKVLEETEHVLLAGDGANRFARGMGFAPYDPVTPAQRQRHAERVATMPAATGGQVALVRELISRHPQLYRGTVGAVAIDEHGVCAAATSTGGVAFKLPGRIGDAPIPGAGNYACHAGAASGTGHGELALRSLLAFRTCAWIESGLPAAAATTAAIDFMRANLGDDFGIIAVDRNFRVGAAHGSPFMPHAWATAAVPEPVALMRSDVHTRPLA